MKALKSSIVMILIIVVLLLMSSVVKVQVNKETGEEGVQEEKSTDMEGNASAQTQESAMPKVVLEQENYQAQLVYITTIMGKTMEEVSETKLLKDIDEQDTFLLIIFSSGGYAVLINGYNYSCEYSNEGESPYSLINQELYYLGVLQYCYKENEELHYVRTKERVPESAYEDARIMKNKIVELTKTN